MNYPAETSSQLGDAPIVSSICISMVKNEQDIIEPFLRHNRKFFDAMIVMDHGSTDETRAIAMACARELGGIFVTDLRGFAYAQAEAMSAAMQFCQSSFFADFVCFLDADEFIDAPDRESFEQKLSPIAVGEAAELTWRTFLPDPDIGDIENLDPLTFMTYQRTKENPPFSKVFYRFGGGFDPDITVAQGSHRLLHKNGDDIKSHPIDDMSLMHFPLRSVGQLLNKAVVGWLANVMKYPDPKKRGSKAYQWQRIFELAGHPERPISPRMLSDEAMAYAQNQPALPFHQNAKAARHNIEAKRLYSSGAAADHYETVALSLIRGHQNSVNSFEQFLPPKNMNDSQDHPDIANAFSDEWHWQNLFLDVAPFQYVIEKYKPSSVFDIGCGNGIYLRMMEKNGVPQIMGVDGIELSATVLDDKTYQKVDLQLPLRLGQEFDIVFCLEVVEHINPSDSDTLFDTIAAHARDIIVFSMAEPGQPGNGHINCQKIDHVLEMWKKRGFVPDLIETLGIRALASMSWFRRNLIFLRRQTESVNDPASFALQRIGAMKYEWYSQKPGIRPAAFQEPFPKKGYGKVRSS